MDGTEGPVRGAVRTTTLEARARGGGWGTTWEGILVTKLVTGTASGLRKGTKCPRVAWICPTNEGDHVLCVAAPLWTKPTTSSTKALKHLANSLAHVASSWEVGPTARMWHCWRMSTVLNTYTK